MADPLEDPLDESSAIAGLIGTQLGERYQLERVLGTGGMGAVLEGRDLRLQRHVAIKVMQPAYARDAEYVERFLREARLASKIRHRNVVMVLDYGQTEGGLVYSVMELLAGQDLEQFLRGQPGKRMPWAQACGLLVQIASGLRAAHGQGVIHRDVKPANCFLTTEDDEPVVKVVDFGIAKLREGMQTQPLTGAGNVLGTPSYTAPEMVLTGGPASPRSDVYSLGVLAYRMLTGRLPFTGKTAFEVMHHACIHPVPAMREQGAELPVAAEELVLQMLAKTPEERPADMREVRQRLAALGREADGVQTAVEGAESSSLRLAVGGAGESRPSAEATRTEVLDGGPRGGSEQTAVVAAVPAAARTEVLAAGHPAVAAREGEGPAAERTEVLVAGHPAVAGREDEGPAAERTEVLAAGHPAVAGRKDEVPAAERTEVLAAGHPAVAAREDEAPEAVAGTTWPMPSRAGEPRPERGEATVRSDHRGAEPRRRAGAVSWFVGAGALVVVAFGGVAWSMMDERGERGGGVRAGRIDESPSIPKDVVALVPLEVKARQGEVVEGEGPGAEPESGGVEVAALAEPVEPDEPPSAEPRPAKGAKSGKPRGSTRPPSDDTLKKKLARKIGRVDVSCGRPAARCSARRARCGRVPRRGRHSGPPRCMAPARTRHRHRAHRRRGRACRGRHRARRLGGREATKGRQGSEGAGKRGAADGLRGRRRRRGEGGVLTRAAWAEAGDERRDREGKVRAMTKSERGWWTWGAIACVTAIWGCLGHPDPLPPPLEGTESLTQGVDNTSGDSIETTEPVAVCGNGDVEEGEECDGTDWQGATCESLGQAPGSLGCTASCEFDVSGCVPPGMVLVPGGPFEMGPDDELAMSIRQVQVDTFWIDATEVTVAAYMGCVSDGACSEPGSAVDSICSDNNWTEAGREDHPVNCVMWLQADEYCAWAGEGTKRLPTEAEWEKAARGTDARTYPWGDSPEPSCKHVVMQDPVESTGCGMSSTSPVGSKQDGKSPYGAYDMAGNVWEWVADWYAPYEAGETNNPTGPATGTERVLRGGTWHDSNLSYFRSAYRFQTSPENDNIGIGFRCARTPPAAP